MKKVKYIVIIGVLLMCKITFAQNNEVVSYLQYDNAIKVNFTLPTYQLVDTNTYAQYGINQLYKYVKIDDFGIIDDIGFPELPQYSIDFAIPENATNITVTSSNFVTTTTTLNRKIYPSQEDYETGQLFTINNDYYSSNGGNYAFNHQLSDQFSVLNQKGITLSIFPFTYNPSQNKLTVLKSGTFTITYSTALKFSRVNEYTSISREEYLRKVFCNYSVSSKNGSVYVGRYLIITPPRFENSLTYFANYKRNLGYTVTIANTLTTGTSATDIKNYLQNLYNNANTRPDFVLLVGDIVDIPASGGTEGDYEDPLTDLNYSLLSGDDYFADIFLGRWSVSSPVELQRIINKTVFMESNLHKMQKRAIFLAGGGDGDNQFDNPQRWVMDNTFEPEGWTCDFNFAIDGATRTDGLNALNNNYLFFIYRGHGGKNIIGSPFSLTEWDVNNATNTLYPMFFSFACLSNDYGWSSNCFGESWIRSERGGVSYFGATTTTMRHTNNVIEEKVFGDAFTDEEQLVPMINLGMKRYWKRFWSWTNRKRTKRHMKSYNFLGDPSFKKSGNGCVQNFSFSQNEIFNSGDTLTYQSVNNIENNSSFILNSGSRVTLIAGNSIILKPGFRAVSGSEFHAFIASCTNTVALRSVKLSEDQEETNMFSNNNAELQSLELTAYPNPFKDVLTIKFKIEEMENVTITLSNQMGSILLEPINSRLYSDGIHIVNISTVNLPIGIYFYKIKIGKRLHVGKLLKIN